MNQEKFCPEEEYSEGECSEPLSQTLRVDTELFKDEDNIAHNIISVRLVDLPNNGEDWEITDNNRVVVVLRGIRFTKKEKEFLRSAKGFLFIINGYKQGWRAVSQFKKKLR